MPTLNQMGYNLLPQDNLNDCLDLSQFQQMKKINQYQDPRRQHMNMEKLLEQQIQRIEPFIYEMERQNFPLLIVASRNTL